jgi:DNA polymerase-3 subunit epsilon
MSLLTRLQDWLRPSSPGQEMQDGRWVVLDVESSGLDPRHDRLLAIAAVAVHVTGARAHIELGDSFEVVLQQPPLKQDPDRANILLHGIGVGAQRAGTPRPQALQAFVDYAAGAPLMAFHAAFDRVLIARALQLESLPALPNPWLDLEPLAAVLRPEVKARSLDEWMQALGIHCAVRHQAAADTLATAELLLKLWPPLLAELPQPRWHAVQALAAQRRWLPGN